MPLAIDRTQQPCMCLIQTPRFMLQRRTFTVCHWCSRQIFQTDIIYKSGANASHLI